MRSLKRHIINAFYRILRSDQLPPGLWALEV